MTRYVAPNWLFAERTVLNWPALAKGNDANPTGELSTVQVLRWAMPSAIGLPRSPFTVWTRPIDRSGDTPLAFPATTVTATAPCEVALPVAAARVTVVVATPSGALTLDAYDGAGSRICGTTVDTGTSGQAVTLPGSGITRVRATGTGTVASVTYLGAYAYANADGWTPVEVVGLPVDVGHAGPYSTAAQGLVGAPTDPADAALARLKRAAPQAGWPVPPGGEPTWAPPDFDALVDGYQKTLVAQLVDMLTATANPLQHAAYRVPSAWPDPADQAGTGASDGTTVGLGPSSAAVPPLGLLALACHGDIYAALGLGFATGYPGVRPTAVLAAAPAADLMVTVTHAFTLTLTTGAGTRVPIAFKGDLAAFFAPAPPAQPDPPGNLTAQLGPGGPRPTGRDLPRVSSVVLGWNRPATLAGSMAAVSAVVARTPPGGTATLLVPTRQTAAPIPFVPAMPSNPTPQQASTVTYTDGVFPDPAQPTGTYTYLACGQNRWGVWSDWTQTSLDPPAEQPQQPLLVGVALDLTDPGAAGSSRAAVLRIDLSWDWHDRSPRTVEVAGAFVPAATSPPAAPPAAAFAPTGSATPLTLTWTFTSGTTTDPPAASLPCTVTRPEPPLPTGEQTVPDAVGRYRVDVPITLDFSAGTDVAVACWIRGTEQLTGLTSGWTAPRAATVHNPVPPLPPGPPGPVTWTSLPDALGVSRAHLSWPATAGATAYVVYHADETGLLAAAGLPPPDLSRPIPDRAVALDAAVRIESVRDTFTRVSADPITGTTYDVELPRGSRVLHGFVVLARSAAGVESPWPARPPVEVGGRGYTLMGIPAPAVPRAPAVTLTTAAGGVSVQVTPPADPVERVQLFRTSVARLAADTGTMGPPVATVATSPAVPAGPVTVLDAVAPSWRPYWYRAVAWGATDDANGLRTAAGPASVTRSILLPPATAPAITGAAVVAAAGSTPSYLRFDTDAPPASTPLGEFKLLVVATSTDGSGSPTQALLRSTLSALPVTTDVPAAGADLLGPAFVAADGSIGVVLAPPAGVTVVGLRVSITDPRGLAQDPTEVTP